VYFNGTLYTYAYGVSELLCGNCSSDYLHGEPHLRGGALVGASLGDRWGEIKEPYFDNQHAGFVPLTQTARGFTFNGPEVAWFYLQSELAPADTFGLLSATSRILDGFGERDKPPLVYTMSMDAFVPVPEPGTFVLVSSCLAGALIRRRYQKQKGTIT
jgi:hypothetical protein